MDNHQNNWKTIFVLTESFHVEGIPEIFEVSQLIKVFFNTQLSGSYTYPEGK